MDATPGTIVRHLIEEQLHQLGLTGLFLALTGNLENELQRVRGFWNLTKIAWLIAQNQFPESTCDDVPVIYNPSEWSSDQFCGYTGPKLRIFPSGVIASQIELWLLALNDPERCKNHFLKCALWYAEMHGSAEAGLRLLLDLFDHGYFAQVAVFVGTLDSFVRCYALEADLSFMHGTTLANVALINENLNRAVREYRKIKLNPARYNEVLGVVIDLALDRVQAAYEALSLDDWIVREARVFGPALWLSQVHPSAEKIGVTGINRTMLSRFNEMASDIHGSIGWRETQAEHELPPNWEIGGLPGLAGIYRKRYPENSWLDRMTEDRLLMPNSVRELVRGTDAQTLGNLRLPRQWRLPSEKIILPLCIAHRRQPALLRSADFTTRCLSSKIRAMHLPPNEKSRAAARRRLMEEESSTIVAQALQLANVDVVKVDRLAEMRTLYPWHPTLCRLAGIFYCLAGDLDQAFPQLIFSVLIEPQGSANWMAIAKFAEFTTFPMMLRF